MITTANDDPKEGLERALENHCVAIGTTAPRGAVALVALGQSATISLSPFVDEIETASFGLQLPKLREFRHVTWPVETRDAVIGAFIVDLDLLLANPSIVEMVDPGWIWAVVVGEQNDWNDLARALAMVDDRAGAFLALPDLVRAPWTSLGHIMIRPSPAAHFVRLALLDQEFMEQVSQFARGRVLRPFCYPTRREPRVEKFTESHAQADIDFWSAVIGRTAQRCDRHLEMLFAYQVASPELELPPDEGFRYEIEVPEKNAIPVTVRWLRGVAQEPGRSKWEMYRHMSFGWC